MGWLFISFYKIRGFAKFLVGNDYNSSLHIKCLSCGVLKVLYKGD